jgi:hypothetical protein
MAGAVCLFFFKNVIKNRHINQGLDNRIFNTNMKEKDRQKTTKMQKWSKCHIGITADSNEN